MNAILLLIVSVSSASPSNTVSVTQPTNTLFRPPVPEPAASQATCDIVARQLAGTARLDAANQVQKLRAEMNDLARRTAADLAGQAKKIGRTDQALAELEQLTTSNTAALNSRINAATRNNALVFEAHDRSLRRLDQTISRTEDYVANLEATFNKRLRELDCRMTESGAAVSRIEVLSETAVIFFFVLGLLLVGWWAYVALRRRYLPESLPPSPAPRSSAACNSANPGVAEPKVVQSRPGPTVTLTANPPQGSLQESRDAQPPSPPEHIAQYMRPPIISPSDLLDQLSMEVAGDVTARRIFRQSPLWRVGMASEKGQVRDRNEDYVLVFGVGTVQAVLVADGCGGTENGDAASALGVSAAAEFICLNLVHRDPAIDLTTLAELAVEAAACRLRHVGNALNLEGLNTTLFVLLACSSNKEYHYAYKGDGMGVVVRADNSLERMLMPHRNPNDSADLTAYLGREGKGSLSSGTLPVHPGDVVLCSTDGIPDRSFPGFEAEMAASSRDCASELQALAEDLVTAMSNAARGAIPIFDDNLSLVILMPATQENVHENRFA